MKPRVDRKRPSLIGGTVGAKNTNETKKLAPKFKFFSPPEFFAFVAAWDQFDEIEGSVKAVSLHWSIMSARFYFDQLSF